jgi:hypothetical protein
MEKRFGYLLYKVVKIGDVEKEMPLQVEPIRPYRSLPHAKVCASLAKYANADAVKIVVKDTSGRLMYEQK